jgi:hypothetical protein
MSAAMVRTIKEPSDALGYVRNLARCDFTALR